jgi:hypothetical protein
MASTTIGWRALEAQHRRWIIINALIISAFMNLVINGVLAWFSVRTQHAVPVWALPALGKTNLMTDTIGTFFFLPFFTCLTCTTAVWAEARAGRLPRLEALAIPARLAHGRLRRGAVLGLCTAALLAPIAAAISALGQLGSVSPTEFVVYKMVLGVLLGLALTPLIAILAMADNAATASSAQEPS